MLEAMTLVVGLCVQTQAAPRAVTPPTDQEVLRALPRLPVNIPLVREVSRGDMMIVKNRIAAKTVRLFGATVAVRPASWECVAYYKETTRGVLPVPFRVSKARAQVVYVEK